MPRSAAAPAPDRPLPPWLLVLAAGAGTMALTLGARQSMGLFLGPINTSTGLGLAAISLAFAVGQLTWGLAQPLAGIVADRLGAGRVLLTGIALVALGLALVPWMQSAAGLVLAIGVLSAVGAGMAGPAVLMASVNRLVAPERRGMASGVVNAGGSFGQFVFAPIAQGIATAAGWVVAVQSLALFALLALPAAWVLRGDSRALAPSAPGAASEGTRQVIRRALADRNYRLLAAGFFVCGFHVAFLATHLPGVVASCGLSPQVGAWALAVLGLANIAGSLGIGWAIGWRGGWWRLRSMLAAIYALRGVAVLLFVLAPKTPLVLMAFAAVMGVSFLSTVPPTATLVARFFGPAHMATLFGIVMLTHQIGGFLGAWLGGVVFQATGEFTAIWLADILLAVGATLLHLRIGEAEPTGRTAARAPAA